MTNETKSLENINYFCSVILTNGTNRRNNSIFRKDA